MCQRTVLPNGTYVVELRQRLGWSQAELEWQSALAVESLAAAERAAGLSGPFTRYMRRRLTKNRPLRVARGTISLIERGHSTFPTTLAILAAALGVPPSALMLDGATRAARKDEWPQLGAD